MTIVAVGEVDHDGRWRSAMLGSPPPQDLIKKYLHFLLLKSGTNFVVRYLYGGGSQHHYYICTDNFIVYYSATKINR